MTSKATHFVEGTRQGFVKKAVVFVIFMAIFVGSIGVLTSDVLRKIDRLGSATSDNVQWTLSQLEVDYLKLADSAEALRYGDGSLEALRRQFDIFYSRFDTIENSSFYSSLHSSAGTQERLDRIRGFLTEAIPAIDGSDARLRAELPALSRAIDALQHDIRQLSISGITVFSSVSDGERERVAVTLLRLALAIVALVLLLLGAAISLSRAVRVSDERARKLRDSSQRMETIIATSLDAVVMADDRGRILDVGGAATQLFERSRAELLTLSLTDLVQGDEAANASAGQGLAKEGRLMPALGAATEDQHRLRVTGRRANGETFPVEMSIAEVTGSGGAIVVAYLRDISARIEAERELLEARDNALVAARSKAQFLAVMSHEMRTPLGGLLGTMENLRDTELTAQQREWLDIMEASGHILQDHVNDVLDIAKLEAVKTELQTEPVHLPMLLEHLISAQHSLAVQRGNQLILDLPDGQPKTFIADPTRLRQILMNLLGNAIKFTEDGQITLGYRVAPGEGETHRVMLFVADTGVGIPLNRQADIFEDFVTLDSDYSRISSGTGLGLGIVRRLVEVMAGEIDVDSVEGQGSRFTLYLDLMLANPERRTDTDRALAEGLTPAENLAILLVEDNAINRRVIGYQLEAMGHDVTMVEDGLKAEGVVAQTRFDIILMDISMPGRDGIATTAHIRQGGPNQDTPIVALTAHALPEERARFAAVGMQDCLTKPVRRQVLEQTLSRWATKQDQDHDRGAQMDHTRNMADAYTDTPLLDRDHLADMRAEVGEALFAQLAEAAQKDGDKHVTQLPDLAGSGQAGEVAHRLAGTAASFGAKRLHRMIAETEETLRDEASAAERRQVLIAQIVACWQETRAALGGYVQEH